MTKPTRKYPLRKGVKYLIAYPKVLQAGFAILIGLLAYGQLWSLLTQLFYPIPHAYLWSAFLLALHPANNPPKLNTLLTLTFITPIGLGVLLRYHHYQRQQFLTLFGDAHWASTKEIKKMGLWEPGDVIIGRLNGKLLMAKLVSHLLVFAPSRSGKGVSQVIPNALCFKGSLLVTDIKQEVYEATSGFRAQYGQQVYLFSPGNAKHKTHCWNPLDFISDDPGRMIGQLQAIIEILLQKTGKESDPMWTNEARALALGLLVWLKNSGRPFTLGELNNLVKGTANFVDYLKTVLDSAVIADNLIAIDPVAFMNLNNFIQKSEKEQSGVKSSLTSCLTLWDDPYVVAATAKSDFDIRQMRQQPMTIYLGIPANQLERLAPLMNLFVQQFIGLLTEELPQPDEPHRVLAILDEFCNLGKMQRLRKGFSYLAGYHVHLMPVIQNVAEFYALYGKDESDTFFQNTEYKIMYRQNAATDKTFVSQLLGDRTVQVKTKSHHSNRNSSSTSTGEQFIKRPLLSPDEIGCFPKDKAILQLGGEPPVKFKRCIYYAETLFTERLLPPTDIPSITPLYPSIQVKKPQPENNTSTLPLEKKAPTDTPIDDDMQEAISISEQIQHQEG